MIKSNGICENINHIDQKMPKKLQWIYKSYKNYCGKLATGGFWKNVWIYWNIYKEIYIKI